MLVVEVELQYQKMDPEGGTVRYKQNTAARSAIKAREPKQFHFVSEHPQLEQGEPRRSKFFLKKTGSFQTFIFKF